MGMLNMSEGTVLATEVFHRFQDFQLSAVTEKHTGHHRRPCSGSGTGCCLFDVGWLWTGPSSPVTASREGHLFLQFVG